MREAFLWLKICVILTIHYLYFMKVKKVFIYVYATLLVVIVSSFSFRIKSGFEALYEYNYFKAKKSFTKGLKYNPAVAAFGLATIYSRDDNPFFHRDSAYRYIVLADTLFDKVKDRKKEKWERFGWTRKGIDSLRQIISTQFYEVAKNEHTVEAYTEFIAAHPWSMECASATNTRDSIAFLNVVKENTSRAYDEYTSKIPK